MFFCLEGGEWWIYKDVYFCNNSGFGINFFLGGFSGFLVYLVRTSTHPNRFHDKAIKTAHLDDGNLFHVSTPGTIRETSTDLTALITSLFYLTITPIKIVQVASKPDSSSRKSWTHRVYANPHCRFENESRAITSFHHYQSLIQGSWIKKERACVSALQRNGKKASFWGS